MKTAAKGGLFFLMKKPPSLFLSTAVLLANPIFVFAKLLRIIVFHTVNSGKTLYILNSQHIFLLRLRFWFVTTVPNCEHAVKKDTLTDLFIK